MTDLANPPFEILQYSNDLAEARNNFSCESEPLNQYFKRQMAQDVKSKFTRCYVAIDAKVANTIVGFYTLSSCVISLLDLPESIQKKLPKYMAIPAIRLGRLAVDKKYKGQKIGAALLYDALETAANLSDKIGVYALLVDAKDNNAVSFYRHHGFINTSNDSNILYMPLETYRAL